MNILSHLLEISPELARRAENRALGKDKLRQALVFSTYADKKERIRNKPINSRFKTTFNKYIAQNDEIIKNLGINISQYEPPKPPSFLSKYKYPLIGAGALGAGVGGAMLYRRMKNKKVQESGSSCDYESVKEAPLGGSRPMNLKKTKRKFKKIAMEKYDD